jgi:glucokinase
VTDREPVGAGWFLGLDIGGSKVRAGLVSPDGAVSARAELRQAATGPEGVLDAARSLADRLLGDAASGIGEPVAVGGIGVASAGVVDTATGRILSAVETIPRWAGTEVGRILEEHTGLPTVVENDVNAVAVAESRAGAAAGATSVLVVAVGTGIGGALVVGGRLHRGATCSAGELGHVPVDVFGSEATGGRCTCGLTGHLESVASGPAIAARYARRTGRPAATLEDVVSAMTAAGGEATDGVAADGVADQAHAAEVVSEGAVALGRVLGGFANAFDPEVIVLSGGVLALGPGYLRQVEAALRAEALPGPRTVRLVEAAFGNDAGLIGAAFAARDRLGLHR